VSKRSGQNIIATAEAVRAVIEQARPTFPPGTVVTTTADQSKQIREMVSSLENNIISGLILVVGVLIFFLGTRTAWFVGLAIPMSMLLSFIVIQAAGMTMNMVVLFSLILALGMLVDNAIVVVENIYRFREQGFDRRRAAKYATGEVALPVMASTATTLAAFLPLAFWTGMVGEFMVYLPLTLITTLSSSLFVGLIIIPTLCGLFLDPEGTPRRALTRPARLALWLALIVVVVILLLVNWLTSVMLALTAVALVLLQRHVVRPLSYWFMHTLLPRTLERYQSSLTWALKHRLRMIAGSAGVVIGVFALFGIANSGVEYFPEDIPPETVYVQIEAPIGTRVELTNDIALQVERLLLDMPGREDVESVVATVGSQITQDPSAGRSVGTHLATVAVNFVDFQDRAFDTFDTMEHMRELLASRVAGADLSVETPNEGPAQGKPVTIEIVGENPDTLRILGTSLVDLLEGSPVFRQLDGLESDMEAGQPELVVEVDRERAALYGLSTRAVGSTVRSAINGTEASDFRDGEDEYDITVRLAQQYRSDLSALGDLTVASPTGEQVPLSSVASWSVSESFAGINRKDLDRMVSVSSDVRAGVNANAVVAQVRGITAPFAAQLPRGYQLSFGGQQEEQAESQAFLVGAFAVALVLIAFILVSQFDSVLKPGIILSAVLLSTVGVLVGLMVFRMPFGIIMTGIGVISLAGIVVNNAIVLLDYIGILRNRDGLPRRDSLIQGGVTRFRPVTLTAMTTILGLVPLAIGLNFDFEGLYTRLEPELYWGGVQAAWWGPMAIAVIVGLAFATFLTLVLVPVMHSLQDGAEDWLKRNFLAGKMEPPPTTTGDNPLVSGEQTVPRGPEEAMVL